MTIDIVPPATLVGYPISIHMEDGSVISCSFTTAEAFDPKAPLVRGVATLIGVDPSQIHYLEFGHSQWSIHACHRSHLGGDRYHLVIQPRTGQVPPVNLGEVVRQISPLATELIYARTKFPSNQYMFAALAEEIGEMAEAWITEGDSAHARHEALQVACVAMRIATEGVNRDGEDPQTLISLALLEGEARDFFASLKHRPDLSTRSADPSLGEGA